MGIRRGSISTPIIADGLVFNIDAANRACYPSQRTFTTSESGSCYNTLDLSLSGSFFGDPTFITQPTSASCWGFDGVDDRIIFDSFTPLNSSTSLTIQLWFKANTYSNSGALFWFDDHIEIYQGSSAYTNTQGRTYYKLSGQYGNPFATLGGTEASGVGNLCDGNWHNICMTWDGATATIYEDNITVITAAEPGTLNDATDNIYIGTKASAGTPFQGEVANIQLYNRALSSTEVLHNYNALKGRFV